MYRLAKTEDLKSLGELRWKFVAEHHKVEGDRSAFVKEFVAWSKAHPNCFHFVAEQSKKIVAMVSLIEISPMPRPLHENKAWGYLTNTYTIEEARGQKIGHDLLEFVKKWASENKQLETIIVWPNQKSITFYKRLGFMNDNEVLELIL